MPKVSPHSTASDQALPSLRPLLMAGNPAANLNPPMRRRTPPPHEGEYAQICKDDAEVLSDGLGMHEETDAESNKEEKIQSTQQERCQPSPKEDMPTKESSESSSEEEQPTDEALCDKAQQWAQQLDTNFDAWWCKKIAKGITGWATRDTMICDLPKHGKAQPNHPDLVGPPLDYMHECQAFNGIRSDIYDLCWFYILGMMGDPPEFPAPREPATHGQIRDLLKSAHAIGWPYLILVHSTDSVTAVLLLRELHTAACLQWLQVDLWDKSVKVSFCPFCAYAGGNDLSYLNNIIIAHYNVSYSCGRCLKQAFISSLALHTHKKVCLRFTSMKAARVLDGKPSSGRGDSSRGGSSKATPKKDGKAAAANSQGLSTPVASQPSPHHSRQGTSHHHKSQKKDAGEKQKKANDVSPAQRSAGHKVCKDWGCC